MAKLTSRIIAAVLLAAPAVAYSSVVTQYTGGAATVVDEFVGESFTTPLNYLYNDLTFNFYSDAPANTPAAAGAAFILSQPYTGTPSALSVQTPGFLATSTSSASGVYTFNPGFIVATGTTYYLYTNVDLPAATGSNNGGYAGGNLYLAGAVGSDYVSYSARDANFTLNGTPIGLPIPEPSTLVIGAVSALAGVSLAARLRRTRA